MIRYFARLARYTGQPVDQLIDRPLLAEAMAAEQAEYWPVEYELLASILDTLQVLVTVTLRAHGAKNIPKTRPFPRPDGTRIGPQAPPATQVAKDEPGGNVISFGKFAEMLRRDR